MAGVYPKVYYKLLSCIYWI